MSGGQSTSAIAERLVDPDVKAFDPGTLDIQSLTDAFEVFNQRTRKLRESYNGLKKQVESVNAELKQKNETLKVKIDELDMTREYLNSILESMSNGLIAVNLHGRITTFNKAAEVMTGYSRSEVLGKKYVAVFPGDAGGGGLLDRMMSGAERRIHDELGLMTKSGTPITVGTSVSPVYDTGNRIIGAIEIFEDLTELKQLEERVRRADRLAAIGEMAASVAHEIRNPLGGIEGFAALLARDLADDGRKCEMARNIVDGTKVLDRIVSSLLDFTRPVNVQLEEVRLEQVIDSALLLCARSPELLMDGVEVRRGLVTGGCVRADKQLMLQVFMNLIRNAVQAMEGEGVLTIETELCEGMYCVRIVDTGCGIPEEVCGKLFMPFVTTKEKGTGLGLSTVMKIVSAHDGTIDFESIPGEGTIFTVRLPATEGKDRG